VRLLFLTNLFPPYDLGGYEQWCQEVAFLLRERGHQVFVLTSRFGLDGTGRPEPDVSRSLYLQADIHHYRPWSFLLNHGRDERNNREALAQATATMSPDLAVVWGMWNLSRALPYRLEQVMPEKVAYVIGSYWPMDRDIHIAYWTQPARRRVTAMLMKPLRALALARMRQERYPPPLRFEHATCCSRYVRDTLVQAGKLPPSAGVLYGGIEPEPFLQSTRTPRTGPERVLRLLYFGSLLPHKGVHTAIEALGILKERGLAGRVSLTILGRGHADYENRLRHMVTEYGIGELVEFAGHVPRPEVPSWLGRFDVFLFTSVWAEPFGRTVLEAMAAGLLVIGTEVGGATEMLRAGQNSLTFEPEDAAGLASRIQRAIDAPHLRKKLAHAGQKMVLEQFTIDRMANEFEEWLGGITGN